MPYFRRMVFMKTFDPPSAPRAVRPQTRRPSFASRSSARSQRASGPTTVRSILFDTAKFRSPPRSSTGGNALRVASDPGLPGAA